MFAFHRLFQHDLVGVLLSRGGHGSWNTRRGLVSQEGGIVRTLASPAKAKAQAGSVLGVLMERLLFKALLAEDGQGDGHTATALRTRQTLSNRPAYAGDMRHPWQTDTFDPGDPELIDRVQAGMRLHEGFRMGATAYEVDGTRWISLHGPYAIPCPVNFSTPFFRHLAYPLPEAYGADPFEAMNAFEREWHREKARLWNLESVPPPMPAPGLSQIQVIPRAKKPAKGRSLTLAGALPLPGLEPWTGFGRQG